jgi:serine/threonine protein kinase/formylglycine-generating enzyme required for sulfatase activity
VSKPSTLDSDSLSPEAEWRLHIVCTEFENEWRAGRQPKIEDYIGKLPESERPRALRELLQLDLAYGQKNNEKPSLEAYRDRFRQHAYIIDAVFAEAANKLRDRTAKESETGPRDSQSATSGLPTHLGKYRVLAEIGRGGFGIVYKAYDDQLQREVAIKVPTPERAAQPGYAEEYRAEARLLARLDHPHIVPVHDLDQTDNGVPFAVYKFIDGSDLRERMVRSRLSFNDASRLVATVADALHHAHLQGLVHRDVKPGNILIDRRDKPYLADFGLALREEDFGRGPEFAGTPQYMSPEQARYEGHRVDGRSDIFSLGVVFYELLTGRRPFHANTRSELMLQIASADVRPPRQVEDQIPKELERICLKALARRASERYTTAKDMAEDLRHFLATQSHPEPPIPFPPAAKEPDEPVSGPSHVSSDHSRVTVRPKGLRSFEAEDADFFMTLLPGPRDRDGLPESVHFWKTRIEEKDPDNTFSVGLVYGPSGCGKSSLFKAGLLPRLTENIIAVYVEATAEDTETRLLNGLRKRCPAVDPRLGLKQSLAALRRSHGLPSGRKLLIVLDQFEQWLHATKDQENPELVEALRHCDGGRVQCIVMVRDDFWLAVSRFMRDLEIDLVPGRNIALVDLFDPDHARKVLAAFGRAFTKLPENAGEISAEQKEFLRQAVSGLARENRIICVRLSLFAEMMKGRDWTPTALKEVGGTEGIGFTFLEDSFSSSTANPKHRLHQKAARAVLKSLLPETGADIKGNMRSREQLLAASGYADRPKDFAELISILDRDLKLITPTDPEGARPDESSVTHAEPGQKYYQLTHDYLVHSLRDWLTRKQKETRRGRAELRLAERSALWNAKPENRRLPSVLEWAGIRLLTRRRNWTAPQQKMMKRADGHYLVRGFAAVVCLGLLAGGIWEAVARNHAGTLRDRLVTAKVTEVPGIIEEIRPYRARVELLLREALSTGINAKQKLNLRLGLLAVAADSAQLTPLYEELLKASPQEFAVIREILEPYKDDLTNDLWTDLKSRDAGSGSRLRAACALVAYLPLDDPRHVESAAFVVDGLLAENPMDLINWKEALKPLEQELLPALAASLEDSKWGDRDRRAIIEFYRLYSGNDKSALKPLEERLAMDRPDPTSAEQAKRKASIAAALASLGEPEKVWPMLVQTPIPTVRSFLIERLSTSGIEAQTLKKQLEGEVDVSVRRALILALGSFPQDRMPELVALLFHLYENDPDAGIHGAAGWALRRWNEGKHLREIDQRFATGRPEDGRHWYVNKEGQTFMVVEQPLRFPFGLERTLKDRIHRFAIASTEVTVEQFQAFSAEYKADSDVAPTRSSPVNKVTWHQAAMYCNYLSERDNIDPSEWCYRSKDGKCEFVKDYFWKKGYRLPTEYEWEFACRAGTVTPWHFGEADDELVGKFSCWSGNSSKNGIRRSLPVGSLKPNDWGLFDMHGNLAELCQESILLPQRGINRALYVECGARGGSYSTVFANLVADRTQQFFRHVPASDMGFRPVRTLQK